MMVFVLSAFRRDWQTAQGIGKRVFGVHCNGTDTAAKLTASPSALTPSLRGVGSSFWIPLRYLLLRFPWDLHTTLTWLVLPFDGLDLLAAVFVFRNVECHAGDYGCMIVRGDRSRLSVGTGGELLQIRTQSHLGAGGFQEAPGRGKRQVGIVVPWKRSGVRHPSDPRAARRLKEHLKIR